jgi:hypothetical protein
MFVFQEKTFQSIRELAKEVKIPYTTLLHRIDSGETLEEAVKNGNKNKKQIVVNNKVFESVSEAAKFFNLKTSTVAARLRSGWSPEEALGLSKKPRKKPENTSRNPINIAGIDFSSLWAAAKHFGLSANMVNKRVKNNGLTIEQALELEPFPEWFTPGKGKHGITQKQKRLFQEQKTGLKICSCCKKQKPLECFHNSAKGDKLSRCRDCVSESFLRYRYKILVKDFWNLYENQKGACAICGTKFNLQIGSTWRSKTVVVDHCHKTGKVRGILCSLCNIGLGNFKDSAGLMKNAIQYLNGTR